MISKYTVLCGVYAYVHFMCVCTCAYMSMHVKSRDQHQLSSSIFRLHCMFWDRVSPWCWSSSIQQNWPVSKPQIVPPSASPILKSQVCTAMPDFLHGNWNSGPHAYMGSIVLTNHLYNPSKHAVELRWYDVVMALEERGRAKEIHRF